MPAATMDARAVAQMQGQLTALVAMMTRMSADMGGLQQEVSELKAERDTLIRGTAGTPPGIAPTLEGTLFGNSQASANAAAGITPAVPATTPAPVLRGVHLYSRNTMQQVKHKELPPLGEKAGSGMPYSRWKIDAKAMLDAMGATKVVLEPFPERGAQLVLEWYSHASLVVYAMLLGAVRGNNLLADKVRRLHASPSPSFAAWEAIQAHFVRVSDSNFSYLAGRLATLVPGHKEDMEVFLSRCEKVRSEYDTYGHVLSDETLIRQVMVDLSRPWQLVANPGCLPIPALNWEDVSRALQTEDNARRQANTKAHDAQLPLGWLPAKHSGTARVSQARAESSDSDSSSDSESETCSESHGHVARAQGSWKMKKGKKPRRPLVCYRCQKPGHVWTKCHLTAEGDGYEPTQDAKDKAQAAR
jgi:hypothetical protein